MKMLDATSRSHKVRVVQIKDLLLLKRVHSDLYTYDGLEFVAREGTPGVTGYVVVKGSHPPEYFTPLRFNNMYAIDLAVN